MNNQLKLARSSTAEKVIKADPSKELFISMLTRDLTILDAVAQLIDNSVDGARRLRPDEDEGSVHRDQVLPQDNKYEGLYIHIEINEERFSITDNCGGISVELARQYAFRFGNTKNSPKVSGSIGHFGLGLKRTLFKFGKHFRISSTASRSRFVTVVDVDEWKQKPRWDFKFEEIQELPEDAPDISESERGTSITVTSLSFALVGFSVSRLLNEMESKHLCSIHRGLTITVNGYHLKPRYLFLLQSDDFRTAYWQKTYGGQLRVDMFAGISKANFEKGGWHIFCNGRTVVGPEQTTITGWGKKHQMPEYQKKYERFRGYLFFNADDASLLPWNTTKRQMDLNSPIFQDVRQQMISLTRSVMDFLDNLDEERERVGHPPARFLETAVNAATLLPLSQVVHTAPHFVAPEPRSAEEIMRNMERIEYYKSEEDIEIVRKHFLIEELREVGEKTFEYFYEMEFPTWEPVEYLEEY